MEFFFSIVKGTAFLRSNKLAPPCGEPAGVSDSAGATEAGSARARESSVGSIGCVWSHGDDPRWIDDCVSFFGFHPRSKVSKPCKSLRGVGVVTSVTSGVYLIWLSIMGRRHDTEGNDGRAAAGGGVPAAATPLSGHATHSLASSLAK